MRIARVRITVKRMMVVIAAIAAALVLVREFAEGIPPRYVLRGIPARIGQLRPGMTKGQTYEVLGLNRSWMWGGISTTIGVREGGRHLTHETFYVRPLVLVATNHPGLLQSSGMIYLQFHDSPGRMRDQEEGRTRARQDMSARLERASFSDGKSTIEMPDSRRVDAFRRLGRDPASFPPSFKTAGSRPSLRH